MSSVWTSNVALPKFEALRGDINTEVLVIGGGMAGLLCAFELKRRGADVVVAEANRICGGITQNTTAKITSQHGLIYQTLIRRFGAETAKAYLRANEEALEQFRTLCSSIDCEFEEKTAYVYTQSNEKALRDEAKALKQIGYSATVTNVSTLPFSATALGFSRQAQFHPLRFLTSIVKELTVYEHTPVRELVGLRAITDHGSITAKKIIVATHFPFLNKHGFYFLKLYQQRSYVIALENAADVDGMYLGESDTEFSFRSFGSLLLVGGGSHRTGKNDGGWRALSAFISKAYPNAREVCRWATQDCMTLDGMPYIGRYSASTQGLYVATGFNKWGMTSSMVAATLLSDLLCGKTNPYASMFSPSRSILHPQLAVNSMEAICNLLSFSRRRCPHMGCALKWNAQEHTWDCPCHGSRFSENGELIDNPATEDLKKPAVGK